MRLTLSYARRTLSGSDRRVTSPPRQLLAAEGQHIPQVDLLYRLPGADHIQHGIQGEQGGRQGGAPVRRERRARQRGGIPQVVGGFQTNHTLQRFRHVWQLQELRQGKRGAQAQNMPFHLNRIQPQILQIHNRQRLRRWAV